jgi:hypothetical protein
MKDDRSHVIVLRTSSGEVFNFGENLAQQLTSRRLPSCAT